LRFPPIVVKISNELDAIGGRAVAVGGFVRDYFLQLESKDLDIEIYNIDNLDVVRAVLLKYGNVSFVGRSFGVLKFSSNLLEIDFSFPRIEQNIGKKHNDFKVELKKNLTFKKASLRRDFTINSIGFDIIEKKFIDPHNGISDLKNKILRVTNIDTFKEDPLRVYRGVVFCARFDFSLEQKSKKLCIDMVNQDNLSHLPKERVYIEFEKLLLKSKKPSIGFRLMKSMGILRDFPELNRLSLRDNIWNSLMISIDKMAILKTGDNRLDIALFLSVVTSSFDEELRLFLARLTNDKKLVENILCLVKYQPLILDIYNSKEDSKIEHLSLKVNITNLVLLGRAIFFGENGSDDFVQGDYLLARAKKLGVDTKPNENFLNGKDLVLLGLKSGRVFGDILSHIYKMQLDGEIKSKKEALDIVREIFDIE
jgi:tRNA nucleotidyltransferase (CCA-adding enzyme)